MKKIGLAILLLCLVLAAAAVIYHTCGWFRGDMEDHIRENFTPEGSRVVSAEYLASGEDKEGGFLIYRTAAADDTIHYIRVQVVFHRYLTKVGPDYKIRGIREIPEEEAAAYIPALP